MIPPYPRTALTAIGQEFGPAGNRFTWDGTGIAISCFASTFFKCFNFKATVAVMYDWRPNPLCEDSEELSQKVQFIALAFACGLVKPIGTINRDYIFKRWSAYLSGIRRTTVINQAFDVIRYINKDIHALQCSGAQLSFIKSVIQYVCPDQEISKLRDQVMLVYSDAEMAAVNLMDKFVTSSCSLALGLDSVVEEAHQFSQTLTQLKLTKGENLKFIKLLQDPDATILYHKNYPDLYYATMIWAKKQKLVQSNMMISENIVTTTSKKELEKLAIKTVTSTRAISSHALEILGKLGVDVDAYKEGYKKEAKRAK